MNRKEREGRLEAVGLLFITVMGLLIFDMIADLQDRVTMIEKKEIMTITDADGENELVPTEAEARNIMEAFFDEFSPEEMEVMRVRAEKVRH